MGAFTTALAVAGTAMKVVGGIKAGNDAKEAADYNAAVYQQQAASIDVKKKISNQSWDRLIKQLGGQITSAVASSGYNYSGSFLDVANDRMTQAYLDKNMENYNLELSKSQALSASVEAERAGAAARSAAFWNAGGTLLTEGASLYSKYGPSKTPSGAADFSKTTTAEFAAGQSLLPEYRGF